MIIDSHIHFGNSTWGNFPPEKVLEIIKDVDFAICSNLEGIESQVFKTEIDCNIEMLKISKKYPKIKPLYVCQAGLTDNISQAREILRANPEFVGLKIHPECLKLAANDEKYNKYLELAREFSLPCLYHSGHIKSRFSSPVLIYEKAKEYPEVPIILGHLSTGPRESHLKAIEIVLESIELSSANLYVDVSWMDFAYEKLNEAYEETIYLIKSLKNTSKGDFTNRILWATDAPVGKFNHTAQLYSKNLNIFKKRILEELNDEELLFNLLGNNAKTLYRI